MYIHLHTTRIKLAEFIGRSSLRGVNGPLGPAYYHMTRLLSSSSQSVLHSNFFFTSSSLESFLPLSQSTSLLYSPEHSLAHSTCETFFLHWIALFSFYLFIFFLIRLLPFRLIPIFFLFSFYSVLCHLFHLEAFCNIRTNLVTFILGFKIWYNVCIF